MNKRTITLDNGKTVVKPRSKIILPTIIVGVFFIICSFFIPISWYSIRLKEFPVILIKMFSPAPGKTWADYFAYLPTLKDPIMETLRMSFIGSLIGSLAALPFAILSAKNIVKTPWIYQPVRFFLNLVRTIPTLVLAVVAMFFLGLGPLPGIVAISIFTFGIMAKMLYEIIETVDMGPLEALESCGANKLKGFSYAVFPQILPVYLGYFIYNFEINVRSSVILGYVGAGGIGLYINENIGFRYDRVGGIVIVLFVLVVIIQAFTSYVRGKLQW